MRGGFVRDRHEDAADGEEVALRGRAEDLGGDAGGGAAGRREDGDGGVEGLRGGLEAGDERGGVAAGLDGGEGPRGGGTGGVLGDEGEARGPCWGRVDGGFDERDVVDADDAGLGAHEDVAALLD